MGNCCSSALQLLKAQESALLGGSRACVLMTVNKQVLLANKQVLLANKQDLLANGHDVLDNRQQDPPDNRQLDLPAKQLLGVQQRLVHHSKFVWKTNSVANVVLVFHVVFNFSFVEILFHVSQHFSVGQFGCYYCCLLTNICRKPRQKTTPHKAKTFMHRGEEVRVTKRGFLSLSTSSSDCE